MDRAEEFIELVTQIKNKESLLDLSKPLVPRLVEEYEVLRVDIDMLFHDLPILTEQEWDKLDDWYKQNIYEFEICPFCHGKIGVTPINEVNYTVECDQCDYIFEEE